MPKLKMYFTFYTDRGGIKRWRLKKEQPLRYEDDEDDIIAISTNIHTTRRERKLELEEIVNYIRDHGDEMPPDQSLAPPSGATA